MKKQMRVLWMLFKLKLSRAMMFRLSFFGSLFVDGSMFAIQLITFSAIYGSVDSIGGWGRGETLLFVGTFSMVNALNMVTYFFGLNDLDNKIRTGALDTYLTKPGSALFRISFENIDVGSLPLVAMSLCIIGYALTQLSAPVTVAGVIGYIVLTLLMTVLWYDMMVLLRSIAFITVSAASVGRLEGALIEMCMRIPGVAFQGIFKLLFMVLLPYGLMGTVPVMWATQTLSPLGLCYSLAIVALFTYLALGAFRAGVRNYKSASS